MAHGKQALQKIYVEVINSTPITGAMVMVHTLMSSSNSMTFNDFFHDLFKFSKTLGLAVSFKNFKKFPCFRVFYDVKQGRI